MLTSAKKKIEREFYEALSPIVFFKNPSKNSTINSKWQIQWLLGSHLLDLSATVGTFYHLPLLEALDFEYIML